MTANSAEYIYHFTNILSQKQISMSRHGRFIMALLELFPIVLVFCLRESSQCNENGWFVIAPLELTFLTKNVGQIQFLFALLQKIDRHLKSFSKHKLCIESTKEYFSTEKEVFFGWKGMSNHFVVYLVPFAKLILHFCYNSEAFFVIIGWCW